MLRVRAPRPSPTPTIPGGCTSRRVGGMHGYAQGSRARTGDANLTGGRPVTAAGREMRARNSAATGFVHLRIFFWVLDNILVLLLFIIIIQ